MMKTKQSTKPLTEKSFLRAVIAVQREEMKPTVVKQTVRKGSDVKV